jgi:CoA:oxalate CoA-transferase
MSQAFAGLRILDFSQVLAAPFGVQQLAMLGAEVIKIEQPGVGDLTRGLMSSTGDGMAPSYMTCNLNKRSLTLDLKHAAAADIVKRLVTTADAVVENMRPGTMERLGFGYQALKEIKADLVYCSVTGYGQQGPKSGLAAFDGAIQASSGMMSISGHPQTGPMRAGYFAVDMATSLNMAFALSAALFRRQTTGLGQHVDVAMMDTAMVMQGPQISAHFNSGIVPELLGNQSPTHNPTANVFATLDSHVQIIALKEHQALALFTLLGQADMLSEERFATAGARVEHANEVAAVVAPLIASKSTEYWLVSLEEVGVPAAAIRSLPEVVADPQFEFRKTFVQVPHPSKDQTTQVVATGHTTDMDPPQLRNPAPRLGADTDTILAELGYSTGEIEQFSQQGAI